MRERIYAIEQFQLYAQDPNARMIRVSLSSMVFPKKLTWPRIQSERNYCCYGFSDEALEDLLSFPGGCFLAEGS